MVKDDDEIIIDTTDINREANANTWCFSPSDTEMQSINTASFANYRAKKSGAARTLVTLLLLAQLANPPAKF